MISPPSAGDEQLHRPGPGDTWSEAFGFEFATPDGAFGGFVVMTAHPHHRRSWCWAAVAGRDRPVCTVDEPDAPLPRRAAMELRAPALWVDVEVEIPFVHATVGMEAFGLAFDDPDEALRSGFGERVPFGLDLEWDSEGMAVSALGLVDAHGYEVVGQVTGEVLIGSERHELDCPGRRWHRWGDGPWWSGAGSEHADAHDGVEPADPVAHAVSAVPFVSASAPDPLAALATLRRGGWSIGGHPATGAGGMSR